MNLSSTPPSLIDVPPGKLASVVTTLEMTAPAKLGREPDKTTLTLARVEHAGIAWYRNLFRLIGEEWLWFSRLRMSEAKLAAILHDPDVELYALRDGDSEIGLLELDFRESVSCELAFFGLARSAIGKGAGRFLMNRAIEAAWARPIERFWVHTCTLDHPDALGFYIRSGFTPVRRQVEIADDPRLTGDLPREAAPGVPIL